MRTLTFRPSRLLAGVVLLLATAVSSGATTPATLPDFRNRTAEAWLNSPPLGTADLRGKVVLIELFTTG